MNRIDTLSVSEALKIARKEQKELFEQLDYLAKMEPRLTDSETRDETVFEFEAAGEKIRELAVS